jgi:hypothetical protein
MPFPESYAGAVANIMTGQHVHPAAADPMPLGVNVPCRRVLLVAEAGNLIYVVPEVAGGQPAAAGVAMGIPIPQIQADGNYTPMELWVNNVSVIWVVGNAGGEVVRWVAEQY